MIQYSGGTIIHRTFTPSSRQNLLDNITQAVSDAGWTTISGTPGSGTDVIFESAAQNAGAKIRAHCFLGASLSAAFAIRALTGTTDSNGGFLNPVNTWRIIANKFTFHVFETTTANRQAVRSWLHCGTLYTPTFLGYTSADAVGFSVCAGSADNDGSGRFGWRSSCRMYGQSPQTCVIAGGITIYNSVTAATTGLMLQVWQGGAQNADQAWRWEDGSLPVIEALVAGPIPGDGEHKIIGQLYDAVIVGGNTLTGESTFTMDGHTWLVVTDTPNPSVGATAQLALAIA
jgi:hypothetical protein